jgi:excisionase family DNA binding protein
MEENFLTAKQVQELLNVDRTTIYRMLKDGRLQGVKMGKHWRFPERAVEVLLQNTKSSPLDLPVSNQTFFPIPCIQSIQDIFAEVAEVGALTTNRDGQPITEVSNSCEFCRMILESPLGRQACTASWNKLARQTASRPVFTRCHAGLMYARACIDIRGELAAILVTGQFYAEQPDPDEAAVRYERLALAYQIDPLLLKQAGLLISVLDIRRISKISGWLEKVAASFKQIGTERGDLINRLRQIAAMSLLENPKFFR